MREERSASSGKRSAGAPRSREMQLRPGVDSPPRLSSPATRPFEKEGVAHSAAAKLRTTSVPRARPRRTTSSQIRRRALHPPLLDATAADLIFDLEPGQGYANSTAFFLRRPDVF